MKTPRNISKKYAKAKAGAQQSIIQAEHTQDELNYLDSIKNSLRNAQSPEDLQDIRLELEAAQYVKARLTKQNKKNKKEPVFKPLVLHYNDIEILVGKITYRTITSLPGWPAITTSGFTPRTFPAPM